MNDTLTIVDNRTGKKYELPIQDGAIRAMDLRHIKTSADDFGLIYTGDARGFMSSNRAGGKGDDDIYFFQEGLTPSTPTIVQNPPASSAPTRAVTRALRTRGPHRRCAAPAAGSPVRFASSPCSPHAARYVALHARVSTASRRQELAEPATEARRRLRPRGCTGPDRPAAGDDDRC